MINFSNHDGIFAENAKIIKAESLPDEGSEKRSYRQANNYIRTVNLFIVGTGNVGSALVEQLQLQSSFFIREFGIDFKITGLANSRRMYISRSGIRSHDWKNILMASVRDTNIDRFTDEMISMNLPSAIFIDNTASEGVSNIYKKVLSAGISVVTCNKLAASSDFKNYEELKKTAVRKGIHFRFESNVGAGLPIIQTINNLVRTGDHINRIEAVVSGSLNFILNSFCDGMLFSDAVIKAMDEGYTEPDPLIDLRGTDVARKLLILVRESGMKLEASEIVADNIFPGRLPEKYEPENFHRQIKEMDCHFEKIRDNIRKFKHKIRVIASYEDGRAEIALREVDMSHPFYNLEGNDNVVSLLTSRYPSRPMIIKGAGAGADVTASGIFSDLLSIVNR